MAQESWHHAHLIPTSGLADADEQERRAASALLSVMGVVKAFSRSLLVPLGAPAGPVETYIEVPFDLGDQSVRPDGLIQVTRAGRSWTALVEVRTGRLDLAPDQLESYVDVAHEQGFDALITISNELPPKVGKPKLRSINLHHWSWSYLLTTATLQQECRAASDPGQAWILGELIRYLEHPSSGARGPEDRLPTANPIGPQQSMRWGTALHEQSRPPAWWDRLSHPSPSR